MPHPITQMCVAQSRTSLLAPSPVPHIMINQFQLRTGHVLNVRGFLCYVSAEHPFGTEREKADGGAHRSSMWSTLTFTSATFLHTLKVRFRHGTTFPADLATVGDARRRGQEGRDKVSNGRTKYAAIRRGWTYGHRSISWMALLLSRSIRAIMPAISPPVLRRHQGDTKVNRTSWQDSFDAPRAILQGNEPYHRAWSW